MARRIQPMMPQGRGPDDIEKLLPTILGAAGSFIGAGAVGAGASASAQAAGSAAGGAVGGATGQAMQQQLSQNSVQQTPMQRRQASMEQNPVMQLEQSRLALQQMSPDVQRQFDQPLRQALAMAQRRQPQTYGGV